MNGCIQNLANWRLLFFLRFTSHHAILMVSSYIKALYDGILLISVDFGGFQSASFFLKQKGTCYIKWVVNILLWIIGKWSVLILCNSAKIEFFCYHPRNNWIYIRTGFVNTILRFIHPNWIESWLFYFQAVLNKLTQFFLNK